MLSGLDEGPARSHSFEMKSRKNAPRAAAPSFTVHRLAEGTELVLSDTETALLVVRGACAIRTRSGALERVEAGAVLLRQNETAKSLDKPVARALALLQADPAKRWTVERLARAVGLSRATFARRFVAVSGCSPLRYLTDLRLALAASLLENDDASLAEVATRVGYVSEFAFSRAFKRRHGVAPGLFRRWRVLPSAPITTLLAAA
jgi:AraC-like DNA-binding protein